MYENLVGQPVSNSLSSDIKSGVLPGSILFSGNDCSGKLTAALETARILSCRGADANARNFNCTCPSCLQHKSLTCSNLILCGPRDCSLEILSATDTFLKAYYQGERYLEAVRYLFLRSVRKLTLRFSDILYRDDPKLNKIGDLISKINEQLELLDFPRDLPSPDDTKKICYEIRDLSIKLESDFLYSSIPVSQIRNMESWARVKTEEGKKTVIIENADRMLENVRNALLKILEEPPADCVFILLTSKRNAVMPTILSRVRTYPFSERNMETQEKVIDWVFHNSSFKGSISDYLLSYLPVSPEKLKSEAREFVKSAAFATVPDVPEIVKTCDGFKEKIEFKIFLLGITESLRPLMKTQRGAEALAAVSEVILSVWNNVTVYNQGAQGALDDLFRRLLKVNATSEYVFKQCF